MDQECPEKQDKKSKRDTKNVLLLIFVLLLKNTSKVRFLWIVKPQSAFTQLCSMIKVGTTLIFLTSENNVGTTKSRVH